MSLLHANEREQHVHICYVRMCRTRVYGSAGVFYALIKVTSVENRSECQHCDIYRGLTCIYELHGTPQNKIEKLSFDETFFR